jgi:aspartate racemase
MNKTIGIVGGVGPFAGLDLFQKIFDLTVATTDQEHLDVLLHSFPGLVPDRTAYLSGKEKINPADGAYKIITKLNASGVDIVGIPCNTIHAPQIWQPLSTKVAKNFPNITLVSMINEVGITLSENHQTDSRIGILATTGTFISKLYDAPLAQHGMDPVYPDDEIQHKYIQDAIYNPDYGIKAFSNPTTEKAKAQLEVGLDHLLSKNVDAIILGCTEIPLSLTEKTYRGIPLYDSTFILARKLVGLANPEKLKK